MTHLFLYNDDRRVAFFRHFLNLEIHFLNNYLQSRGKDICNQEVKNKMKKNYIYACVEELIEKYNTSDPFELMDALDIHCESSNLEHLKGYCVIIHGIKFIAINENLRPAERKIVAAHELGHIILHSDKLKAAAHEDMNIYNIADKTE